MKYITLIACLLAFAVALAAMWPQPQPHWSKVHSYSIKNFCAEHPDVCRRGSRMVRFTTPTPIPSNKGMVVVVP